MLKSIVPCPPGKDRRALTEQKTVDGRPAPATGMRRRAVPSSIFSLFSLRPAMTTIATAAISFGVRSVRCRTPNFSAASPPCARTAHARAHCNIRITLLAVFPVVRLHSYTMVPRHTKEPKRGATPKVPYLSRKVIMSGWIDSGNAPK